MQHTQKLSLLHSVQGLLDKTNYMGIKKYTHNSA
jgi:hypothetical protein